MILHLPLDIPLSYHNHPPIHLYTLSLHDALPISDATSSSRARPQASPRPPTLRPPSPRPSRVGPYGPSSSPRPTAISTRTAGRDRKSTRLNSSHGYISYAVFCLKKKNYSN